MKRIILTILLSVLMSGCGTTKVSTGPSIGIGPVEVGLHLNSDGELELESNLSIPIVGSADLGAGISWDIAFSTVLNEYKDKENYLIVLWEDTDGSIIEQDFLIGQPFVVNFEYDQWVRKIQRIDNGSIVVFVEKQQLIQEEAQGGNIPSSGDSTEYTETFYDLPEDGEVLNRFCADDWETCRSVANANWQDLEVASIGSSYGSDGYLVQRTFLFFDTNGIPSSATIESAMLYVYAGQWLNGNTTIHIVPSSANTPLSTNSYNKFSNESGGSVALNTPFDWVGITLNQNALNWITTNGITKLALIHENDLYDSTPSEQNEVLIATGEDSINRPYLIITYTVP